MSKLGVAAATMGVGGTGAAGTYAAYNFGAFGGGSGLSGDGFANPLHKKIIGDGRQYQPLTISLDSSTPTSSNSNKFSFNNWDCINKLFPELKNKIKHEDATGTTQTPTSVGKSQSGDYPIGYQYSTPNKDLYLTIPTVTEKLVACGQFDWRGGDNIKEKIHFRSEVVVKDENYGWVMWNGLSSDPSATSNKVNFEYRLLTFKKTGNNWEIDKGFGWSNSSDTTSTQDDQFYVSFPDGYQGQTINDKAGEYSTRKIWSGVAKVDATSQNNLIKSLSIYLKPKNSTDSSDKYYTEFFGLDGGKWVSTTRGYNKANKIYVQDKGWGTMTALDLKESLTAWYKPMTSSGDVPKKNVSWMTCEKWANGTGQDISAWESIMKDMCYSQPTSR